MKVSVIIPTYQRPGFLKETVLSVWKQTLLPDEIIIGDDSKDNLTEEMVKQELIPNSPVPIHYFHHQPALREVANVDFQYAKASGDLVLHLHDDDPIYPGCLEALKKPFEQHPEIVASFGLQRLIDEAGEVIPNSENVNLNYFRTPERVGLVNGMFAGTVCMFPNNGFLVKRASVLTIGYSDKGRAGKATDFYFGFRLGQLGKPFYFVNEYTALCRIVHDSQSRGAGADNDYKSVKIILEDCKEEDLGAEVQQMLKEKIPRAITTAALLKDRTTAFKWLFSKYYRSRLLTPRGVKRILQTINPF
ncbi:glycosyltransferase family 2 protein [Mucilaginibacter psychrotolerans]|nr:glycosyltransferase family 2 protein [Mucilaginibacter psychrotolerans]